MLRRLRGDNASRELVAENEGLRAENAELRAANARLETRIAELEAKLAVSSHNSSQPPSADGPGKPPRTSSKRGRKRGGQPGHSGTTRPLVPIEQVDEVVDCRPESCGDCGALLLGSDPAPLVRQVIDIPPPRILVREIRCHQLICLACGAATRAEAPAGTSASPFGVGLHALAALLVGRFRLSKRLVAELVSVLYGLTLSPATVCTMERRVSAALAAPVDEARQAIRQAAVVGSDETGWKLMKDKAWLWLTATDRLAVFTIDRHRGAEVVKQILGEAFAGVVGSDRWSAYSHLARRQVCWAHLLRDFVALTERYRGGWHGRRLTTCALEVMAAYAERQAGTITHAEMVARLEPVRERTRQLLGWAARSVPVWEGRAKARQILSVEEHLWTFLSDPSIPVTNNHCERLLRHAVIWRKLCYGSDSEAGARFAERILSVTATLRLQQRDLFAYLTTAIDAHFRAQAAPSILPVTSEA